MFLKQQKITLIIFFLVYPLIKIYAQEPGDKWIKISGPFGGNIKNIFSDSYGNLYAASDAGIFISKDSSKNWNETGFQGEFNWIGKNQSDNLFVMSSARRILKSTDFGNTWKAPSNGLPSSVGYNMTFFIDGARILVFPQNGGIYESLDEGSTWNYLNDIKVWLNSVIKLNPTTLFATSQNGIYLSYDNGFSWNGPNKTLGEGLGKISVDKNGIIYVNAGVKIYISSNSGINWYTTQNIPLGDYKYIDHLDVGIPGTFIACSYFDNAFYFSKDNGSSWEKKDISKYMFEINDICTLNDRLFIATSEGILTLSELTDSVSSCNNGITAIDSKELVVDNLSNIYLRTDTKIFKSTDKGISWFELNEGVSFRDPFVLGKIALNSNNRLYCSDFYNFYIINDNGWIHKQNYSYAYLVFNKSNEIIASRYGLPGIFISKDDGISWTRFDDPQIPYTTEYLYIDDKDYLYACTREGVYYTPDMGNTWGKLKNLPSLITQLIYKNSLNGNLFVGTLGGLFKSTNNGESWTMSEQYNAVYNYYYFLFRNSKNSLYLVSDASYAGIKVSIDEGSTWEDFSFGLENKIKLDDNKFYGNLSKTASGIIEIDGVLYASTNGGFYRHGNFTSSGESKRNDLPSNYKLFQNYPNPFNPTTTIRYSIPKNSKVTLEIFNLVGQEITTLVNEDKSPGSYEIDFNASNLSSGVYFYRLRAGNFSQVQKFILVK